MLLKEKEEEGWRREIINNPYYYFSDGAIPQKTRNKIVYLEQYTMIR